MTTTYPGAIDAYTTKATTQVIDPGHVNNLQDAVVAVETRLGTSTTVATLHSLTLTTGAVKLAYGISLVATDSAATGTRNLASLGSYGSAVNVVSLGSDVDINAIGRPVNVTGAAAGDLVLANAKVLRWANGAGNGTVLGIRVDSANTLVLGGTGDIKWGTALIALGGGAPPILGTIGGTGPATALQHSWMRVFDTADTAFWVPAWK